MAANVVRYLHLRNGSTVMTSPATGDAHWSVQGGGSFSCYGCEHLEKCVEELECKLSRRWHKPMPWPSR